MSSFEPTEAGKVAVYEGVRLPEATPEQWAEWEAREEARIFILCPHCGDWEDLYEIPDQLVLGRFWCCVMCELAGRAPWQHIDVYFDEKLGRWRKPDYTRTWCSLDGLSWPMNGGPDAP